MCGIGFVWHREPDRTRLERDLAAIGRVQAHRGPDGHGTWVSQGGPTGIWGLAHQRLSILDLSARAAQPMRSHDGRHVLAFNGEIYNYKELRDDLTREGIEMLAESSGDSAVVLTALAHWGPAAFARFNGMWALVLVDTVTRTALCARDRFGKKPLHIYRDAARLVIASELKSVLAVVPDGAFGAPLHVDRVSVGNYLARSVVNHSTRTFVEEVRQLEPASWARVALDGMPDAPFESQRYWRHPFERGPLEPLRDPVGALRAAFVRSVDLRLRSDVPVGVLLSGGLDSSAILGAVASLGRAPNVVTLTVTSDDPASDERRFARAAAKHCGVEPVEINVDRDPRALFDALPDAVWHNDQPLASLSAVAHQALMTRARELGVTVLLTGQGADEQLGGYTKYLPFYALDALRRGAWWELGRTLGGALWHTEWSRYANLGEVRRYLTPGERGGSASRWLGPALRGVPLEHIGARGSYAEREFLDLTRFSVPMLLHYEDRMSMSRSREVRVPFLDVDLVEVLARVPAAEKLRDG